MRLEDLEDFTIKLAINDDSSEIIVMLKQIAQWLKDKGINQWGYLLIGGEDEEIKTDIYNQNTYIVLKDKEMVATFTMLSKQSDWDLHVWGSDQSSESLYLHRIAIQPNYMKKGLGKKILTWIQDSVNDKKYLKLDCVAENKKLNNFYKNNDFELVGVSDGHSKYQKIIN